MLGYSFKEGYPGRGVIEAVGAGIRFRDGELALRANLATSSGTRIVDRRAGRNLTQEEAEALQEEINSIVLKDATFEFRATVSYRGVLVIRAHERLSAEISNTDPAYARVGGFGAAKVTKSGEKIAESRAESDDPAAGLAARLVNEFTQMSLAVLTKSEINKERIRQGKMAANCVLLRDAGDHLPKVESFQERHGMTGTALVEMPAEVGISKLLGMKMIRLKDRNDLKKKAAVFLKELKEGTIVYVHIKGPDEFGHDGDAVGKKKSIETIDKDFFSAAAQEMDVTTIAVSCDHATPCTIKMHSSDPVPLLMTSKSGHDGLRFTEKNAKNGSLGRVYGRDVLDLVTKSR
jgi:2,3-bisphosphoglycerate-independent phosphoglycerate mutase